MSRPLSDTIPDEIAEIIRSNSDWGDLTRFAEKEGLKRSTVYNLVVYRKNKNLLKLYQLATVLDTTVDHLYRLLLVRNIAERKASFLLLMAKIGIDNFRTLANQSRFNEQTIYRYLNDADAADLFRKPFKVSQGMGITMHEFAAIFASEYSE